MCVEPSPFELSLPKVHWCHKFSQTLYSPIIEKSQTYFVQRRRLMGETRVSESDTLKITRQSTVCRENFLSAPQSLWHDCTVFVVHLEHNIVCCLTRTLRCTHTSFWLTCLLTYILTYLHIYTLTYLHTYLLTYLLTYIYTYIDTYLFTYLPTYLSTYLLTSFLTYILTFS